MGSPPPRRCVVAEGSAGGVAGSYGPAWRELKAKENTDTSAIPRFVAVRFGNVLGSRGSVVEVFKRQIAEGGPVTVTDPEMRRYFMTIPEAVQLVLQAAAIGEGGELFVLDMGEPLRIIDLAREMIRLSGLEPDIDIPIKIVGARPGEKLHETLVDEGESVEPTEHPKIFRVRGREIDARAVGATLRQLILATQTAVPAEEFKALMLRAATGRLERSVPVSVAMSVTSGRGVDGRGGHDT